MKLASKIAAGVTALVLTSTAAMAADVIVVPPPAPPPPAPLPVVSPFAGLYFGGYYTRAFAPPPFQSIGAQVGYNFVRGSLLFGVSEHDPGTFIAVAVLLAIVALVASWIPARRAARVDPLTAMRGEG